MKRIAAVSALLALAVLTVSFVQKGPLYKDPSAPLDKRVDDLLSKMTLEEKVSQLTSDSPAIARLDVPTYNWWNECLHGVARAGRATVFPEPVGMAATWDADLIHRVATVISIEGRAKYHEFVRKGKRNIYQGLTFWTPNINIFRDPRWGRGMETYGEDPFLTGTLGTQFIKGIQGDDPKYFRAIATAKHYAVHSGPESSRHEFDAVVPEQVLRETYLPHFEMAIKEGHAASVMCSYNRVDGLPACANPRLLEDILRKEWGFQGYVVSDCGAIGDVYLHHKTSPNAEAGVAATLKAGTDLNCGVEYEHVLPAVKQGLIAEADVDRALRRLLTARFKLGMFDPPSMVKYANIPYSENDSAAHGALALETARKAVVLLKNENHALPLTKSIKTLAVIGPNADDAYVMVGNYNGDPSHPVTPLAGIRKKAAAMGVNVLYARGGPHAANLPHFVPIPTSALQTPDHQPGLKGEYYASGNFDGKMHRPRELTYPSSGKMSGTIPDNPKPVMTRVDKQVDFRWWEGSPSKDIPDDDIGIRWTGTITAPSSGKYWIGALGMNAFELYLDGKKITDFNNIHERSYSYTQLDLQAGKAYDVKLDFHNYLNDADIQLVWSPPEADALPEAVAAAKKADAVVLVLGLSPRLEGEEMKVPVEGFEGGDRISLDIPKAQQDLMEAVAAVGKPTTLVLLNGSAVSVNWAREHIPAIVELWYPGQAGGTALADVLFGDYNPGGRLPVTFYKSAKDLPPFNDYSMKGKTYRFFEGEPLFPFGYGLSYTTFAYRNLKIEGNKVTAEVENTGAIAGDEVAELYVKSLQRATGSPIRALAGFQRFRLAPKEKKTVSFTLKDGTHGAETSVGGKQPGFKGLLDAATTGVVTGTVR